MGDYRRKIDPGEGYRLLTFGEIIEPGDEFLSDLGELIIADDSVTIDGL
jgi:hypothetical protein